MGIFYVEALTVLTIHVIVFSTVDVNAFAHHGIAHVFFVANQLEYGVGTPWISLAIWDSGFVECISDGRTPAAG